MLERSWWFKTALVVVVLSAVVYLAGALGRLWGFLGDLFLVLFFAWLIGSVLIHVINSLMRIPHMTRPLAITLVYFGLVTLIFDFALIVIPETVKQVRDIAAQIPSMVDSIPGLLNHVDQILAGLGINFDLASRVQIQSFSDFGTQIQNWLTDNAVPIVSNIVDAVISVGLTIVLSVYIVLDGGRRLNEALKVLPPKAEAETRFVLSTIDDTFHGYVRGMLLVSAIYGVGTASVMIATGLPAALPAAILSSLLLAVPFIGDQLALVLPVTIAIVSGDFITVVIVLAVLLFIQQVMLHLLTPRIMGHAVRMPAMLVVVSVVFGARLAGVPGALLGVPTTGVIYSLSVHYGMRIRQRREAREAVERDRRQIEEEEGFAQEVERALQGSGPAET